MKDYYQQVLAYTINKHAVILFHLWSVNKSCQLVDLLSRLKSVEEHWGHARSTNRTASDEVHASTVAYSGVVFWNLQQKTDKCKMLQLRNRYNIIILNAEYC